MMNAITNNYLSAYHYFPILIVNLTLFRPWEFRLPEYMVHDEHRPFGNEYDYQNDPEGIVYWKKGRVAPGKYELSSTIHFIKKVNQKITKLIICGMSMNRC